MFVGARPRNFLPTWKKLTSDPEIVLIVKGAELEFAEQELPFPICSQPKLEESEMSVIDSEVEKLEAKKKKKVISHCQPEPCHYLSPVFTRRKKRWLTSCDLELERTEQRHCIRSFQNGDAAGGLESYHTKLFSGFNRPQGRLQLYPHCRASQDISGTFVERAALAV